MHYLLIVVFAMVDAPLIYLAYRVIFRDAEEFLESLRFWLTPDILSAFRGEFWEDWWAEMKLGLFVAATAGLIMVEAGVYQSLM
jgi:hypothetical protein